MSASASSDSDSHRRKRLRKGTHSCLECRRRKVRCIFEPNSQRCDNCMLRETACTKQDVGRERQKSSEHQKQHSSTFTGNQKCGEPAIREARRGTQCVVDTGRVGPERRRSELEKHPFRFTLPDCQRAHFSSPCVSDVFVACRQTF